MIKQFLLKTYRRRLERELDSMNIKNLEEYTIESNIGCGLTDFYKKIIEAAIDEIATVTGEEISDGKYELVFLMANGNEYPTVSKGWYTKEYVLDTVMDVLLDYLQDVWNREKLRFLMAETWRYAININYKLGGNSNEDY